VIMKNSDRKADAHAFLDWLLSSPVQGNLPNLGLGAVK
jgi:molybdate transport system substrate-binding protein